MPIWLKLKTQSEVGPTYTYHKKTVTARRFWRSARLLLPMIASASIRTGQALEVPAVGSRQGGWCLIKIDNYKPGTAAAGMVKKVRYSILLVLCKEEKNARLLVTVHRCKGHHVYFDTTVLTPAGICKIYAIFVRRLEKEATKSIAILLCT